MSMGQNDIDNLGRQIAMAARQAASPSDKSKPLNADRDAQRWAREFKAICAAVYGGDIADRLDDGWLISWFANAIMCGEDTYRWRKEAEAKAVPSANQRITEAEWLLRECVEGLVTDCTAWNRKVREFLNTTAEAPCAPRPTYARPEQSDSANSGTTAGPAERDSGVQPPSVVCSSTKPCTFPDCPCLVSEPCSKVEVKQGRTRIAKTVRSSIEPLKRPEEGWRLDAFESALARAINGHSIENESNTPDFILAMLARDVLIAFAKATKNRERWYGKELRVDGSEPSATRPSKEPICVQRGLYTKQQHDEWEEGYPPFPCPKCSWINTTVERTAKP